MCHRLLVSLISLAPAIASATGYELNDTGTVVCEVGNGQYSTDCDGTWTDADFGRDADHPSDKNGYAGFSFTKLGPNGETLKFNAPIWSCIKDNVTGLVWENKNSDGSTHDGQRTYNRTTNFPDTLAAASNAEALCGYTDWRLPARRELMSIVSFKNGSQIDVDQRYFQNTVGSNYWTSTPYARDARETNFWLIMFSSFRVTGRAQGVTEEACARVVRSDKKYGENRFIAKDQEIEDKATGLTWKRCSVGQVWADETCSGQADMMTYPEAKSASKEESIRSGKTWRLPNIKELDSIIDTSRRWRSAIDTKYFPDNFDLFATWTISNQFAMSFNDGASGYASIGSVANARLVRDTRSRTDL